MSEYFNNAFLFLISTLFDLYLIVLVIRLILVWIRSDYFNPLVQFIIKVTNFIIRPTRKVIPNIGRIETATLFWIFLLEIIKFSLLASVSIGGFDLLAVFILAAGDLLKLFVQTFFYAIIAQAILSWFQPHSPFNYMLYQFTSPIMRPIQRVVPPIGGIDISPIPALILLQLVLIIVVNPILMTGWAMTLGRPL